MKKSTRIWIFFLTLISCAAVLFSASRFRSAETPPWRASEAGDVENPPVSQERIPTGAGVPFTFVSYNIRNWLVSGQNPPKSQESKNTIVSLLSNARADVIGLCEIGNLDDLAEVQAMLKAKGTDLPYSHHTGGTDSVRHLGILSRFPIVSTFSPDLKIADKNVSMRRGILDATVSIGENEIRFIGLHLKSKLTTPDFDERVMRMDEATHARKHIGSVLAENPEAMLVVYGDFNDDARSLSTRAIFGTYRTPGYMSPVHVKDSRGETWTHFYSHLDSYTRIDFVTVSKALKSHVDKSASRIIDDAQWEAASDHRPVLVGFR